MDDMFQNWGEVKNALLEGLDANKRDIVGKVLENQKNYVLTETAASGSVATTDIAGFRKIMIPMIRRIIPGTIATEIVGVQPMSGPVGLVYSMRYKNNEAMTGATNAFGTAQTTGANAELFGNTPALTAFYSGGAGDGTPASTVEAQTAGAGAMGSAALAGDYVSGASWPSSVSVLSTGGTAAGAGGGSYAEGIGGRKISLEVVSQAVEAGTRKLQAGWTMEAMQDLKSQHGLNIESELTSAISAEIVQEIDAEIIADLLGLAGTTITHDNDAFGSTNGFQPAYLGDRFANIGVTINWVANEIGRKTRRGVGNFIVVSPMVVSLLQSASKSVFAPAVQGSFKGPNNTQLVGTLNGTIKVYSYLWNQAQPGTGTVDRILVGYKGGNGETDTGYFYCPYVPLMSSGVVMNPSTFQPVVSMMTRYGKTYFSNTATSLGNSADYYGKITLNDIAFG